MSPPKSNFRSPKWRFHTKPKGAYALLRFSVFCSQRKPCGWGREGPGTLPAGGVAKATSGILARAEGCGGVWTSRVWVCSVETRSFLKKLCFILGYMVAQTVKRLPAMQETWVRVESVYNSETQTVLSSSGLQTGCPHVEFSMLCNSFPPFSVHFRVYQPRQKGTGKTVKCRAHPGTTSTPVVQMRCRNLEAGNQKGRW